MPAIPKFAKQAFAAGWGQAFAALLLLVSIRVYTQEYGPDAFGQAMLALGALALVDGVGSMAFGQTLAQLLKDLEGRSERIALGLGLGQRFSLWLAALAVLSVLGFWYFIGPFAAALLALACLPHCVCEPLRVTAQTVAMLERRFTLLSAWSALEAVLILVLTVAIIRVSDASPAALVIGQIGGRALATLLLLRPAMGPKAGWEVDRNGAAEAMPAALSIGWVLAAMAPIGWFGAFADRYILGATTGLAAAGVLAALSGTVSRPFAIVSSALTNLFRADFLDEAAYRTPAHTHPLRRWLLLAALTGAMGVVAFAILGDWLAGFLIRFETPGIDAGSLLVPLAISQTLLLMSHAFDNRLMAFGRNRALLTALTALIFVGFAVIGISAFRFGAEGAAWGRVFHETLRCLAVAALVLLGERALHIGKRKAS